MRSTTFIPFLLYLTLFFSTYCSGAPSSININNLQRRQDDNSLGRAFGLGLLGVKTGLESTLNGIQHPNTHGSREDTQRAAAEAGNNVGGAIGSALMM